MKENYNPKARQVRERIRERFIEILLGSAAYLSVAITLGIAATLLFEALPFFREVPLKLFLTDQQWTPLFADPHYGILPLLCGTLVTTFVATMVAIPMGTTIAIYLSEYAKPRTREIIKPLLEVLSAIPTVVFGYFALLFVTPMLQKVFPTVPGFSALSAGIVMGIMIIPYISSLSEDAMHAVPMHLREGAYAMGSTRIQTARRVVFPAAISGITAAYILGISRAIGETMVVAIAAGMQPNLTLNPAKPVQTITAYIVQVCLGDLPHASLAYRTIFVVGLTLFLITLIFNLLGQYVRRRFREIY